METKDLAIIHLFSLAVAKDSQILPKQEPGNDSVSGNGWEVPGKEMTDDM